MLRTDFALKFPKIFVECRPSILVVTDGLDFSVDDFGLSHFVRVLANSTIHGMAPRITVGRLGTANNAVPGVQVIDNFSFTDPHHGLQVSRYDVLFIFGFDRATPGSALDPAPIAAFMAAGGGVFATGDHEDLGAFLCGDIPRVRAMRHWFEPQTPNASDVTRLTTSGPGTNVTFEFNDQADSIPQTLYPNYRAVGQTIFFPGPVVRPIHPLLQRPNSTDAIRVSPDHPHEGECLVPDVQFGGEWPHGKGILGFLRTPRPVGIAATMSFGNGFGSKLAVSPRSFWAIAAYDGHAAEVGRIVTDATWHHFININMTLEASAQSQVDQYFRNLAIWLMPKHERLCWLFPVLLAELLQFPLLEELPTIEVPELRIDDWELGHRVAASLRARYGDGYVEELAESLVIDVMGPRLETLVTEPMLEEVGRALWESAVVAIGRFTRGVREQAGALVRGDLDAEKFAPRAWTEETVKGDVRDAMVSALKNRAERHERAVERIAALIG